MDPEKNTQIESAEELEAEKEHLAEVKEDEVRASVIEEFGFNETEDSERIDKLVAKEIETRKKFSKVIGQKIKYREASKSKPTPQKTDVQEQKFDEKDFDRRVNEKLEQRDLESMEYPDDIKKVIAQVAKVNETSVRKAVSDPYVMAKIEAWQKVQEAENASITRKNRGAEGKKGDIDNPPDVDMATKEGRDEYEKWKQRMIKEGH